MSLFSPPEREDLLSEDVRRLTLRIAVPSLLAMLAGALCTVLDALLLSRQAPAVSAGVGICFPLLTVQQAVGFTLGMGAGSHVSRAIGAEQMLSARQVASTALACALAFGFLLTAAGLVFLTPLLTLLGAQGDTIPHAIPYARLLLGCSPFSCCALVLGSLLRAQGKTAAAMLSQLLSCASGAMLSLLLIGHMGLGVHGAGISLCAREALACALLAFFLLRSRNALRPSLRAFTPKLWVAHAILRSGLPTLLRQGAASLSSALLSRIGSDFGAPVLAGIGLAVRVQTLITSTAIGFGQGFAPVCGVCCGAGQMQRVREAYRFSMQLLSCILVLAGVAAFFLSDRLLALFQAEAEVSAVAVQALRVQSPAFVFQGAVILMNALTQSLGLPIRASLVAVSRQGLFLIPLLLILPRIFGVTGLLLCQPVADLLSTGFSLLVVRGVDRSQPPH